MVENAKKITLEHVELGRKNNEGKLPLELISPVSEALLADVLRSGAIKYSARNWEKGLKFSDVVGAIKRHLNKIQLGEMIDSETNQLHAAELHAETMFLLHFIATGTGENNLPHYNCKPVN